VVIGIEGVDRVNEQLSKSAAGPKRSGSDSKNRHIEGIGEVKKMNKGVHIF
jgi:hypothetical protein